MRMSATVTSAGGGSSRSAKVSSSGRPDLVMSGGVGWSIPSGLLRAADTASETPWRVRATVRSGW